MQYGVRVVHGKGLTPASLVDELRAVGMQEASVSKLLPADFIRLSGLALLIQNQLLREGQCQVSHAVSQPVLQPVCPKMHW